MVSGQQQQELPSTTVQIGRNAMAVVLMDESFAIPTEENKKCLIIVQSSMKHFNCNETILLDENWQRNACIRIGLCFVCLNVKLVVLTLF